MKTVTVEDIDKDLRRVRDHLMDSVHDSVPWKAAWERIDELLDQRSAAKLTEDKDL